METEDREIEVATKSLDEVNKQLTALVESFSFTDDEYRVLERYTRRISLLNGRGWLGKSHVPITLPQSVDQIAVLRLPLEDMPLHINGKNPIYRIIARWRLEIGR
jgi:hypothetical protein